MHHVEPNDHGATVGIVRFVNHSGPVEITQDPMRFKARQALIAGYLTTDHEGRYITTDEGLSLLENEPAYVVGRNSEAEFNEAAKRPMIVCAVCGSQNVQIRVWVYANTHEIANWDGLDETSCDDCSARSGVTSQARMSKEARKLWSIEVGDEEEEEEEE